LSTVSLVALDTAYAAHPERFPNGPPLVRRPPDSVAINPLSVDDAAHAAAAMTPDADVTSHEVVAPPAAGAARSRARRSRSPRARIQSAPLNAILS
jgi:hypothetical protein